MKMYYAEFIYKIVQKVTLMYLNLVTKHCAILQ